MGAAGSPYSALIDIIMGILRRTLISIPVLIAACTQSVSGQSRPEAYVQTDLVSAYLWRGQRNAGVSLQPVVGVRWRGLHFYVWANEQLCPPSGQPVKHEIDFFLKYSVTPAFTVGLKDVYVNTRGDGFFSFGSIPHAANGLDVLLAYDFRYLNLEWTTTVAGYDGYNHSGRRSYGSYFVVNVPFSFAWFDWNAQLGIVPYYCSRYSDDSSGGFHVNMCALKVSHTFGFSRSGISVTPFTQLMVNPSARKAYVQAGARFYFSPSARKAAVESL